MWAGVFIKATPRRSADSSKVSTNAGNGAKERIRQFETSAADKS